MTLFHLIVKFLIDLFSFTPRLLKGRVSLPSMFGSSCQFIFSSLKCIIEVAERSFFVCNRSICLGEFLAEGVPDLGLSAWRFPSHDTEILTLSCSSTWAHATCDLVLWTSSLKELN